MVKSPYPSYQSNNPLLQDHANDLNVFEGKSFLEFNEIIGLPIKNGVQHPIYVYDYELEVMKAIEANRNIRIKKSRGIGITELILRYILYKHFVFSVHECIISFVALR